MDLDEGNNHDRLELIDIYNHLTDSLRKQLLILARVIDTTKDMVMAEMGQ